MQIYQKLMSEIENLKQIASYFVYGESALGEPLIAFVVGKKSGKRPLLLQASIHAREYITAFMAIELVKKLLALDLDFPIIIVPLANPDGVRICLEGASFIKDISKRKLVETILKSNPKELYKANAKGVDLNCNFDAGWGSGGQNIFDKPSYANFVGYYPNSEKETQALIYLTRFCKPYLTLSLHTKGEVVYYGYKGQSEKTKREQKYFLPIIERASQYKGVFTTNSGGGYKDFCLLKLDTTGFTLEFGSDHLTHPIGLEHLDLLFDKLYLIVLNLIRHNNDLVLKNLIK